MRSLHRLLVTSVAAAAFAAPGIARASPAFPPGIRDHLELNYTPPCHICHATDAGGGPVVHPFGFSMVSAGLSVLDPSTVGPALDTLAANMVDSDCNHIIDTQQLGDGRNPNAPGEFIDNSGRATLADPGCSGEDVPAFGCLAAVAPRPTTGDAAAPAAALVAVLALSLARVRARPRRRR